METFCIGVAIVGLMMFAYRGWSIILIAPFFAIIAALLSEFGIMPTYSELYMTRLAEYTKTYYPVFLFGAVFARLMEKGGLASAIAGKIISLLGEKQAVLAVILGCAALTYGGLSVFVVAFVMYPFGAEIFRKANIPKNYCRQLYGWEFFPSRWLQCPALRKFKILSRRHISELRLGRERESDFSQQFYLWE